MPRTFLIIGAFAAFLAVAFGAFGAHSLRDRLTPEMLAVFNTGAQYQMMHALGLILIALLPDRLVNEKTVRLSGSLLTAGIILFSGSLYVLSLTGVKVLGAVTPLGGVCFLAGWLVLTAGALRNTPR